jgi:hypothetical protein
MISKISNLVGPLSSFSSGPPVGGSIRFGRNDTTPRYISVPASSDWAVGTGDFCVEWFQYQTQVSPPQYSRVFQVGDYDNHAIGVSIEGEEGEDGRFLVWIANERIFYFGDPITNYLNQWVYFAVVRNSGQVSVYQNGARIATFSAPNDVNDTSNNLLIGFGSGNVWNGYLTNFRFTKGNSIYDPTGTTISVPTEELSPVTGTKLLLNFPSGPSYLQDSSVLNKTVTRINGAVWSSLTPF